MAPRHTRTKAISDARTAGWHGDRGALARLRDARVCGFIELRTAFREGHAARKAGVICGCGSDTCKAAAKKRAVSTHTDQEREPGCEEITAETLAEIRAIAARVGVAFVGRDARGWLFVDATGFVFTMGPTSHEVFEEQLAALVRAKGGAR